MKSSIPQNLAQCAFNFDDLNAQPLEQPVYSLVILQDTTLKQCIECKKHLPLSEFTVKSNARDGLEYWCKKCNMDRKRNSDLRSHYGISSKQYDRMFAEQGGVCACCGQPETRKRINQPKGSEEISRLHVDHDHQTGKVRALLCGDCNTALGMMDENPDRIHKLKEYAEWCKAGGFSMIAMQEPPPLKKGFRRR